MTGLTEVFATTAFIGGKPVAEFELAYAEATNVAHCVGVANGTDALELALRGVGVAAGGEVILPANTFIATAEAVSRIGAVPVLVDVDDEHLLIDPDLVAAAITPRTQAIVAGTPLRAGRPGRARPRGRGGRPRGRGRGAVAGCDPLRPVRRQGWPQRPERASTRGRTSGRPETRARSPRRTPISPRACG